jgi:alanyl-tRNA synthetase
LYKIPKDNLYVSVFEGSKEENVPFDQEAYDIWKTLIDEDRIFLEIKKIISGKWEIKDHADLVPKFTLICVLKEKALKPRKR